MLAERMLQWPLEWEKQGMEKGVEKGEDQRAVKIAINMLKDNMPLTTISRLTDLKLEIIRELKAKHISDDTVQEEPTSYKEEK